MSRFTFRHTADDGFDALQFPSYLAQRVVTGASLRGDMYLRDEAPSFELLRPSGYTVDVHLGHATDALTCTVAIEPPPRHGQTGPAYLADAHRRGALEHFYGADVLWQVDGYLRPREYRRSIGAPRQYKWQMDDLAPWERLAPDDWRDRRFRARQRVKRPLDTREFIDLIRYITCTSVFSDVRGVIEYHR